MQEGAHHAPAQCALSATAAGGDYVLNGSKVLVADAGSADSFIVIARSAGAVGDEQGLSAFLVDAGAAGVSLERRSMVDSRGYGALTLDDVKARGHLQCGVSSGLAGSSARPNTQVLFGGTWTGRRIQRRSFSSRKTRRGRSGTSH